MLYEYILLIISRGGVQNRGSSTVCPSDFNLIQNSSLKSRHKNVMFFIGDRGVKSVLAL